MAEEDLIYGKNRHLFGGIEPSNMISFKAVSSYQVSTKKARIKIVAELPKETTINGQTLCTIAGAIIRKKEGSYPKDEFDGALLATLTEDGSVNDDDVTIGKTYYYAAFPYTEQGVYNRSKKNRAVAKAQTYIYLYGYDLKTNDSNPATRVTYPSDVDNASYTAAGMNFASSKFDYGGWPSTPGEKFMPRPCMLGFDGVVKEYLDPDDYTKKTDGSASSVAKSVFDALGAKTYVINNEPNGVNINTNCGSTHIEVLQEYVKEKHLNIGFAYDGDADRCIAVDENGNVVDGDRIIYVCGKYLMEQGKLKDNTVVTTIMSNLGLYKACDKIGMKYEQTAVGDKYVYENMLKNGYVLGGEQSGHIIFSKHARTGDGILTSLMVMEAIIEKKQTLGTLADEVKIFPQLLKNVRVKDKKTALDNAAVQAAVEKTAEELGTDGRILVRESGTEPVIRVMVEAASDEICEKYVDSVVKVIESEGLCE